MEDRVKAGLKANEVCDVTSLVPKCMFLRVHTCSCTLYKICTESAAAPWASNAVCRWVVTSLRHSLSLLPGPARRHAPLLAAVHSACGGKHGEPNAGRLRSSGRSSWWTDEDPESESAGRRVWGPAPAPAGWRRGMSVMSRWGLTGGSCTGGALGRCEAGAGRAPESGCGGPSALAPACAQDCSSPPGPGWAPRSLCSHTKSCRDSFKRHKVCRYL